MEQHFDFFKEFIDVDFDNILLQNNNPLFNSDEHYCRYKKQYLEQAYRNKELFEEYSDELQELQNQQVVNKSTTKVIYTFVDEDKIKLLKQNRKQILAIQRQSLQNFLHYLNQLNIDSMHLDVIQIPQRNTKRSPSIKSLASIESKRSGIFARIKRTGKKK
jgi:Na+/phosphate symporter